MRKTLGFFIVANVSLLPALASAETRNVVVFFTEWSAQIDQSTGDTIKEAAELAKQKGAGTISVTGFADTTGTAKATALLSATRAQVVVDQLVRDGVPQRRIRMTSKGATSFTQSSLESHKVTIDIPLR